MNVLYLAMEIVLTFSAVLLAFRFFGKSGLYAWIAFASVVANIMTAKTSDIGSLAVAQGTVLFASTFLATDILCERFDRKSATKGVFIGLSATLSFVVASQIALLYKPSVFDYAHEPMAILFGLNLRICLSSVTMYLVANLLDVFLFERIKKATGGRALWLRNNVATIVCNCTENFAFIFLAFYGVYSAPECAEIAIATSIVEAIVAVCDTPFIYIAERIKHNE